MNRTSKKKIYTDLLWLLPFFCFFLTYITLHIYFKKPSFPLENMTGCDLAQAAKTCSAYKLRLEIIESKEDAELPDGTIIHQIPAEGNRVKERQTVFVVITQKPAPSLTPTFIGLSREEIDAKCAQHALKPVYYSLSYPYPSDYCFCQYPTAQTPIQGNFVICYVAAEEEHHAFLPNFVGADLQETLHTLDELGIKVHTNMTQKHGQRYVITEQQPKAGALLDLDRISEIRLDFKISTKRAASS